MNDQGPKRPTRLALRLLGVLAAALLLLALILAITRDRNPGDGVDVEAAPTASASDVADRSDPPASPSPDVVDLSVLDDPAAAEAAGGLAVLEAGRFAASDAWLELTDPAWHDAMEVERPVYVGDVLVSDDRGRVDFDLVVAFRSDGSPDVSLRFLPGAEVLVEAGSSPTLVVTVDGAAVDHDVDGAGALVTVVDTVGHAAGAPMTIRLVGGYDVPDRAAIRDDGGPAGFGLLARSAGVTMLGHSLPLLTFDSSPMIAWGDVGAFPVAVWSLEVRTAGVVATGGRESDCITAESDDCVLARGTALRDVAIAVFDDDASFGKIDGTGVFGPSITTSASVDRVLEETRGALDAIGSRVGPLPWGDLDVVLAPLTGAAGMEFPGLVIVDPEYLDRLGGGFGTFVIAHEVAHQWFHALLGNSSLTDPVVDESLAQYASLWYYRDVLGEAAANGIVDRYLVGRYLGGRDDGVVDVAPASVLAAFGSNRVYGPMTYARAPLGWVVAEEQVGESAIVAYLAALVARHGLGEVSSTDVRTLAVERGDQAIVEALDRWWFDPAPAHDEVP